MWGVNGETNCMKYILGCVTPSTFHVIRLDEFVVAQCYHVTFSNFIEKKHKTSDCCKKKDKGKTISYTRVYSQKSLFRYILRNSIHSSSGVFQGTQPLKEKLRIS